ncbi:MAG TPA: right-handed parallel beta-helix repeat-containing protein [Opitutaceae bacterium]|nr:right-handed parallel beta-helix repeat-containing protein [Opitutaceae bacterium]
MNLKTAVPSLSRVVHTSWCCPGILLIAAFVPTVASAYPSGGPYGPVDQVYQVPANAAHVYYVAPDGQPSAAGTTLAQPTTLGHAIDVAVTGDAIILRGGTYRTGNLEFNQGITLQPYLGEHPVLKGTEVAKNWIKQPNGLWRIAWPHLFPAQAADWWQRERSGRLTPPYRFNNDMVFVDGKLLHAVGWEGAIDANTYFIDYPTDQVYIGVDPTEHVVEITAFDNALTRVTRVVHGRPSDHKGPTIRGITFTQYAFRAMEIEGREAVGLSDPATFGKDVVGTTLENDTISYCSRVAGYFRGDHLTIRNCLISDTRTEGVYVLSSGDVLLERNIFRRNNIENMVGYFPAAVKIFDQCYHAMVRDNLVIDQPNSNGVWFDVGNVDGHFIDNWVQGAQDGFFFEISKGAVVAGNVFVDCDKGTRALNSSNVHIYHNTYLNSIAAFERTERSAKNDHFGWHPSTGPDVDQREGHVFVGNLMVADPTYHRIMVEFDQAKVLCGKLTKPQVAQMDGNVYIHRGESSAPKLVTWAPTAGTDCTADFATLDAFHQVAPQFDAHSTYLPNYYGAVFRSASLSRLEPVHPFVSEADVPAEVRSLAGWPATGPLAAGADPVPQK